MQKPFAITLDVGSSLANHTGSWRNSRPVYLSRMPPCNHECPAGENIQAWLFHAESGDYEQAWRKVVERCRANDVIPELSFMLASPHDPEGETERSFEFIRRIKRLHPATEIMLYVHTPLPPGHRDTGATSQRPLTLLRDADGRPLRYPDSADGWADPAWLRYWCHQDAPWLSPRLRQRIADFGTVLASRYPTVSDIRTPPWQKSALSALAAWRYGSRRYDSPWELDLSRRFVRLWDPRVSSL